MVNETKLKNCPFCGSSDVRVHYVQVAEDAVETWIECHGCTAKGQLWETPMGDRASASVAWNTRAAQPVNEALVAALEDAAAWIAWDNGLSPEKQGAVSETLTDLRAKIDDAIAKAKEVQGA